MRQKHNGFTWFMQKLDGKKIDNPEFTTPDYWSPANVRLCLSEMETTGDVELLMGCMNWATTPQGSSYWSDIYYGRTVITAEGLNYLYWLQEQRP